MKLSLFAFATFVAILVAAPVVAQVNVTTYHNDDMRTGWNQAETALTQRNLGTFGMVHSVALDDQVDAEPLVVSNQTINGSQHNVVYVATESNSVYAIDAQSGQVLLQTNLGTPVPRRDLPGGCGNNGPRVGVDSTPVIDASSSALYVIAYVFQNRVQTYYLHALSLTTLQDLTAPVMVSASGVLNDGSVYQFNAAVNRQRPALLLANGNIYAGFGSFCDLSADLSRGWVLGWQESTLSPLASNKLNDIQTKSPDRFFLTSVWMSGYGLSADGNGSVFFVTGNSDYSGTTFNKRTNIAESAAVMSPDLSTLQGLFTPGDHSFLDRQDEDFGSGGLMLLPPQRGVSANLAVAAGKNGNLYVLDAGNLGKNFGQYAIGACWCGSSYYQDSDGLGRIVTSGGHRILVWPVIARKNGTPELGRHGRYSGIAGGQSGGFFTSVSSNGTVAGTAVVWAVGRPTDRHPADVDLYAVNPDNNQLLFSGVAGEWPNTGGNSNTVPMVANGFVYVATDQMLTIFGLGGAKKHVALPPIRYEDVRPPLPPGEHEIYGLVRSMKGAAITIEREGKTSRIDTALAQREFRFAPPSLGRGLIARGKYDSRAVVLYADTIEHAVDHSVMWPSDR